MPFSTRATVNMLTEHERGLLSAIENAYDRQDGQFAQSFAILEKLDDDDSEVVRVSRQQRSRHTHGCSSGRSGSGDLPRPVTWLLSATMLVPLLVLPVAINENNANVGLLAMFGSLILILVGASIAAFRQHLHSTDR
jgi:hypothetical protein